ncbi:SphA family protein [Methylohalobius crimeensis]|uniref:SphA family protein n=1 Tax=Methylohalobius crimeensis TaxID=244365 RepID=UPI0003B423B7|nr:transporter [Methylohalobius crimeensis]
MTVKNGFFTSVKPIVVVAALSAISTFHDAEATEGGMSHYVPGAYNDFFMNLQVDPGFYFRDDLMYYNAQFPNEVTLGRNIVANADLAMWTTTFKLVYVSDFEILGARYGAGLFLPVVFDAKVEARLEAGPFLGGRSFSMQGEDNRGGVGDLVILPLSLTWKWGDFNINLSEAVFMPSGFYDKDEIVNLGRNHWSFDTIVGLTWLHPTRGHEISFNVGFMSNTVNDATQYQSGDEFHLDYTVAQHFSEEFGVGVTGYYYNQLSDDEGPLLDRLQQFVDTRNQRRQALGLPALSNVGGFQGEAIGIGPIVRYSPKFGDKQIHFIGKWIHEFNVENRFEGEIGMLSVAFDF